MSDAGHDGKLLRRHGADERQHYLATVRVAGEHERDVQRRSFGEATRIVPATTLAPIAAPILSWTLAAMAA